MSKAKIIFIIAYCILITIDIWLERSLYHYALEFLNLYGVIVITFINALLDYWIVTNGKQMFAV